MRSVLVHLGTHLGLTLVLRFPLGSLARFGWTVWQRTRAEWAALRGRPVGQARSIHTPLVAAVSLVPGFGAAAYLLAGAVRQHRLLTWLVFDSLLRKLPLLAYSRAHLEALTTWCAGLHPAPASRSRWPQTLKRQARATGKQALVTHPWAS